MKAQYYVVLPGGTPAGPYSLDTLKLMAFQRKIGNKHLYCEEGMPEWRPITELEVFPKLPAVPSVPTSSVRTLNTHMVSSILLLIFSCIACLPCFPFALVALIQACRAEQAGATDMATALRLADSARFWVNVCYVLVIVCLAVVFVGFMITAA